MLKNHFYENKIEAGCDEAGRGCLAGSVYAAAVILPPDYDNPALNDSKQLTAKQRNQLRQQIEHDALAWAVGIVTPEEIDRINILRASFLAMHRALDQLTLRPEAIIVDGNRFQPYFPPTPITQSQTPLPHTCIARNTTGSTTWDILLGNIVKPFGNLVPHPFIVFLIICWVMKSFPFSLMRNEGLFHSSTFAFECLESSGKIAKFANISFLLYLITLTITKSL